MSIVAAVALFCEVECPDSRKCIRCVFLPWAERVADHLGDRKGKVIRIEEWKMEKERINNNA